MDFYGIIIKIGKKDYPVDDKLLFITNLLDDIEDFITVLDLENDFRSIVSKFVTENLHDSITLEEFHALFKQMQEDIQTEFHLLVEEQDILYEALFKNSDFKSCNHTFEFHKIVDLLLTSKFRVLGQRRKSRIYDAIEQDNLHLFKAFLSNQNESHYEMVYHESFLQLAIMFQSKNIMEFLLKAGLNINEINQTGNTPTHYVLKYGDVEMIEYFQNVNADFKVLNNLKETALDFSFMNDSSEVLGYLCEQGYYDSFAFYGNSRFANALNYNSEIFHLIQKLLDDGFY